MFCTNLQKSNTNKTKMFCNNSAAAHDFTCSPFYYVSCAVGGDSIGREKRDCGGKKKGLFLDLSSFFWGERERRPPSSSSERGKFCPAHGRKERKKIGGKEEEEGEIEWGRN